MLLDRHLETRINAIFRKAYGNDCPITSIYNGINHSEKLLEVHTGGYRDKIAKLGFVYVRDGYFSSLWKIPEALFADDWAKYSPSVK